VVSEVPPNTVEPATPSVVPAATNEVTDYTGSDVSDTASEASDTSDDSEEEYVVGEHIAAWILEMYHTIAPDQKFTRADVVNLFANAPKDLFAD
jgi:hypothetical protein